MLLASHPIARGARGAQHSASRAARLLLAVSALAVGGCATPPPTAVLPPALTQCLDRYGADDARLTAAGVRDAQAWRVPGHPWLRLDRLLASFADELTTPARRRAWLLHASALDAEGRALEHARLATASPDNGALSACRAALLEATLASEAAWPALRTAAAGLPDDYSTARRVAGLYPVSARVVLRGVRKLQRDHAPRLLEGAAVGSLTGETYAPPVLAWPRVAAPRRWSRDALGVPRIAPDLEAELIARHAPSLVVETRGADDRPGRIAQISAPYVADDEPTVYTRLAYTRFEGQVLPQLVYTWWFAARTAERRFDPLAGPLDGLTWRVTLDDDGAPLAYDVMHNCGCYHMFFPTARLARRAAGSSLEEPPWVPFAIPAHWSGAPRLGLAAGSHYLTALAPAEPGRVERVYTLRDYDELRALPGPAPRVSLFDARGLVPGSARGERWFLWPMGVVAPGSMRQWGHHATAFVGRRHFDDARLLERYFSRAAEAASD
ncbi:MAG: hypothetical protein AB7I01_08345 [Gammaproteobacteria bacterium]